MNVNIKALRRTGRVLDLGTWAIIAGVITYSLMTSSPFVAAHSDWAWSGPILGVMTDVAFVMALQAESVIARHGITSLGRWPAVFRWFTGLATTFLNVWESVASRDWTGVAVHAIAPLLLLIVAEVAPIYRRIMAEIIAKHDEPAEVTDSDIAAVFVPAPVVPSAPVLSVVPPVEEPEPEPDTEEEVITIQSATAKPTKAEIAAAIKDIEADGHEASGPRLAAYFGVSDRTGRRYLSAHLAA